MEPDKISSSPYKPGTKEHSLWIQSNVITKQLDQTTIAWSTAKTLADDRLLNLASQYHNDVTTKALALEQLIASLPINTIYTPVLSAAHLALDDLIKEVNETWEKTKLGIVAIYYKYIPFINSAPLWIDSELLYECLHKAVHLQWHEWGNSKIVRFAVHEPLQGLKALLNLNPGSLQVSQVEIGFKTYVRF